MEGGKEREVCSIEDMRWLREVFSNCFMREERSFGRLTVSFPTCSLLRRPDTKPMSAEGSPIQDDDQ